MDLINQLIFELMTLIRFGNNHCRIISNDFTNWFLQNLRRFLEDLIAVNSSYEYICRTIGHPNTSQNEIKHLIQKYCKPALSSSEITTPKSLFYLNAQKCVKYVVLSATVVVVSFAGYRFFSLRNVPVEDGRGIGMIGKVFDKIIVGTGIGTFGMLAYFSNNKIRQNAMIQDANEIQNYLISTYSSQTSKSNTKQFL
jgi:hypothetical protein